MQKITPFLWFDGNAEEAANFYTTVFKNSKIVSIARYPEAGHEVHGQTPGKVMTVAFELNGQTFTALNGGPIFKFNEAISFVVDCADQEEIDYYWQKLSAHGDAQAQQCGWLKDQFGLSWQDRAEGADRTAESSRPRNSRARDGGDDADEEN